MLILKRIFLSKKLLVLVKRTTIEIQKRFYPAKSFVTTNVVQKILSPQVITEQAALFRNKFIFHRYCEHLKQYSLCDLLNDKIFIQHMHDCIHKEPSLYSRAFQLALEVTYSKRKFSENILQEIYKQDFIISDTFKVNAGLCDQSTIYTSILAKKVVDYLNLSSTDVVVNSTPLFLTKNKITDNLQNIMVYNKNMTENTCPDATIKYRPHDFKDHKDISYGKNHIYFLDLDFIAQKGNHILYQLERTLISSLKNQHISEELFFFTKKIIETLQDQRHSNISIEEQVEGLNKILFKSNIPKDFKIPLFIPIKKSKIESLDIQEVKEVFLEKGHLDSVKAKKAIMGILDLYDYNIKKNIQEITHNSIQFKSPIIDEID